MDIDFFRFSRNKCNVIRVEFTQCISVHSNFTAINLCSYQELQYTLFVNIDIESSWYIHMSKLFPQTTQTAHTRHTLYLDRLNRPIVSRHAVLQLHVRFFDYRIITIFTTLKKNTPIFNMEHTIL